jgi:PAS domain S-box-containing protein
MVVEQSLDITRSDLGALYLYADPEGRRSDLNLFYRRGRYEVPGGFPQSSELIMFLRECDEAVVLLDRKSSPFSEVLLAEPMASGIALPISTSRARIGVLFLNARNPDHYRRERFDFLESFARLASGVLHNNRLFTDLRETLRRVEELERYQSSIFNSMTDLLVTTDRGGAVRYYNQAAADTFGLGDDDIGRGVDEVFGKAIGRRTLNAIHRVGETGKEILGVEGIYKASGREMDFSLNASRLQTRRGRAEGLTLLFTDQSRERELKGQMEQFREEGRVIKDMFSRYVSSQIVAQLVERPDMVKPGGDKKEATIFFSDIRGYTSFSEGKDAEYIISVLNEYFGQVVEIVLRHHGLIDKYIGDALMAAWGVSLETVTEDARRAVTCAMEIQELAASTSRRFFNDEASRHLKIGIGLHTGPVVAGNLGSSLRMDYTFIGDPVNVAARLEGVAGPGEVIITESTRSHLDDSFKVKKLRPVSVKGKSEPIPIYRVLEKAG